MPRHRTFFCPKRAKAGKNAFFLVEPPSCYQRKIYFLLHALRRQSERLIYHLHSVNVLLTTNSFLWPSGDVPWNWQVMFYTLVCSIAGSYFCCCCHSVCGLKADVSAAGAYSWFLPSFGARIGCKLSLPACCGDLYFQRCCLIIKFNDILC